MQANHLAKFGQFYSQNGLNEDFMSEIGVSSQGGSCNVEI